MAQIILNKVYKLIEWEKIYANFVSVSGLISRIHGRSLNSTTKKNKKSS